MPVHTPGPWPPEEPTDVRDSPSFRTRSVEAVLRAERWAVAGEQNIVSLVGTSAYAPEAGHLAEAWAAIGAAWDAIGRK
jgi:hypothetical protein